MSADVINLYERRARKRYLENRELYYGRPKQRAKNFPDPRNRELKARYERLRAELSLAVAKGDTERARELTRQVVECDPLGHSSRKWK